MICSACGKELGSDARFCSQCGRKVAWPPVMPMHSRLWRPRVGRVFGGVCAGFAQEYGWDAVLVRLALCFFVLFGCGTPILAYLIAWIIMPNEPYFVAQPPMSPMAGQAA